MFKTIPNAAINNDYELEYHNPVGLLFKNHVFLHDSNKILEFDIHEIKRLFLKKERDLKLNFLLLSIAAFLLVLAIILRDILVLYRLSSFGFAGLLLLAAMAKKTYQYKIILFTDHSHYFTVPISEEYKEDASELLSMTKNKMSKKSTYLKVI